MSTTATPTQAPIVAGLDKWETRQWFPEGELPAWLDELRAMHLAAYDQVERDINYVVDLRAENEQAARDWRRAVRDAVSTGGKPPAGIDTELNAVKLEVAQEDATHSREELAKVALVGLAQMRAHYSELAPHLADCHPDLQDAIRRGPEYLAHNAAGLLEEQLAFLREPSIVNLADESHAAFTGDGDETEASHASA